MSRILVRFNTKWEQDEQKRQWRVVVDGVEELAHKVKIRTACDTIQEAISTGEIKHHFLCEDSFVTWDGASVATIATIW